MKTTAERKPRDKSVPFGLLKPDAPGGANRAAPEEDPAGLVAVDPLIHERTRLAILTALATSGDRSARFLDLRDSLHLTDGNLMTHLRTLEQAGLIQRNKTGAGRGSTTTVLLTPKGARAFKAYLDQLEALIEAARSGQDAKA
ncbi:MAG: transcriptional regulator [Planctomycetota bacterium]|nr:transcriptional regulator [Planctomycetota bacterium]